MLLFIGDPYVRGLGGLDSGVVEAARVKRRHVPAGKRKQNA